MTDILIIDDSATSRLYYREILESVGFSVEEAINGLDGLEKILTEPFALILVDLNMPKMDGLTFLEQLRRDPQRRTVPALMISTQAQGSDREKAYGAGANAYVVKPIEPDGLAATACLMIGRRPVPRAAA
jgi:two-component system chemotaxis response regulator CheY